MSKNINKNNYLNYFFLGGAMLAADWVCAAYPDKPMRIVAPNPAGSVTDIVARPLATRLSEAWGVPVVIDNRPGAGGNLAGEAVARAAPDGHTLLVGTIGILAVNPYLYPKMPFDTVRAFAPVTLTGTVGMLLVVHPSVPVNNVKELIALAKSRPGQLTYPSSGAGTTPHLAAALFLSMTGTKMLHVAYKGSPQYTIDLISGRLELAFASMANVIPHIRSGRLRLLATTMDRRDEQFPQVPTIAETGVPGYDMRSWYGLLSTAGTPPANVEKLSAELARILALPEVRAQYLVAGLYAASSSPAAFTAYIAGEREKWARVVKAADIRAE
jgi:tripartite-type tricarboxylate transporter receptor subunit TctC